MTDQECGVFARVVAALEASGTPFTTTHHEPVYTSQEAAEARGTSLHSGAKALIVKGRDEMVMVVLPADMALDNKALRKHLGCKGIRFATKEELLELTGLTPGSIPPFGSLFDLRTICDERMAENETINFNAGSHADSVYMTYEAYLAFESPEVVRVAKEVGDG